MTEERLRRPGPDELLRAAHDLYDRAGREVYSGERNRAHTRAQIASLLGIGHAVAAARHDNEIETLVAEREAVRTELARIDQKAGIMSGVGVLLSVAVAVTTLGRPAARRRRLRAVGGPDDARLLVRGDAVGDPAGTAQERGHRVPGLRRGARPTS